MTFTGEHTWASQLGYFLTAASFACALFATVGFFLGGRKDQPTWTRFGTMLFRAHSAAVLGIVVLLFIMLFNHWFEFDYVWKHSNLQMPLKYIASCFWEGQEGSFLLWTFWHVVLGNIVLWRARPEWRAPVMTTIAFVQAWLASMLLGIHVFDVRIGMNPFILIREHWDNVGLPWTQLQNYLQAIPQFNNGRGLNPLLQNYWMVIHPPTLFLGFAATLVPFAYAIAGLWKSRYKEWIEPALPWTYFGVMVLGTGILMGGAWAYEALSFGGFWAWDPVENGSLVPWIVLVGAGHVMLVNRRKESPSLFTTYLLVIMAFLLVLYATFLTRSGVLGDTSVHSFTGEGYEAHLLFFMFSLVVLSVARLNTRPEQRRFYLLLCGLVLALGVFLHVYVAAIIVFLLISAVMTVVAYSQGPFETQEKEERIWTREFWLFMGALVLVLSSVQIGFSTSIPVFNILLEPFQAMMQWIADKSDSELFASLAQAKLAPPSEAIAHYNRWQIPFAIIVSVLVGFGQWLRWKDTPFRPFARSLLVPAGIALGFTVLISWLVDYRLPHYVKVLDPETQGIVERLAWPDGPLLFLLFATLFAVAANVGYFVRTLKGRLSNAGPSVAHSGFALVLLGALISTSRQHEVSRNLSGPDLRVFNSPDTKPDQAFSNDRDAVLYLGDTVRMGDHFVVFTGKRFRGVNLYYDMDYLIAERSHYRAGDTVRVRNTLFTAKDDHTAGQLFIADQPAHWIEVDGQLHTRGDLWHARPWVSAVPGERDFSLEPLIQINQRFGEVAEPSTRHWIHRDLYTHIRYADRDTADTSSWMPPRLYEKHLGDTIVTPTTAIVIDSIAAVRDSAISQRLGPEFVKYEVYLRVHDLYAPDRWFRTRPVAVYKGAIFAAGKAAEVPQLRQKFELASVQGNAIGLNIYDREFVVLQAIVFPGINILWIGCVLMALGTFMAVRQRITQASRLKSHASSDKTSP